MLRKSTAVMVSAVLAAVFLVGSSPGPVYASCTGQSGNFYAAGGQTLPSGVYADAMSGKIQWTEGNMCGSGVSHSVTLLPGGGKWLQAGWRYYYWYTAPKMYCEGTGSQYFIHEFSLSAATHTYRWALNSQTWECSLDLVVKDWTTLTSMGFSRVPAVNGQGEAHELGAQIGLMAPGKLSFTNLQYRRSSNGVWTTVNVSLNNPPSQYGNDSSAAGQMRVWTNAN